MTPHNLLRLVIVLYADIIEQGLLTITSKENSIFFWISTVFLFSSLSNQFESSKGASLHFIFYLLNKVC